MMWTHWCKPERAWINTERGKPCNWCDAPEKSEPSPYDTRKAVVDAFAQWPNMLGGCHD